MKNSIKKLVFYILMTTLTWVLIELTAISVHFIKFHDLYSPRKMKEKIVENINMGSPSTISTGNAGQRLGRWGVVEVIHPYVGYVLDPHQNISEKGQISNFGFVSKGSANPIRKKSPHAIIIGVFGGSFALHVYQNSSLLHERFNITGKEIVILNFARGGGKQPEQLSILAYMLSLGAEFDMIINIDGFNEVALPPAENIPKGVYPFYPRQWYYRARNIIDPLEIRQLGYLEFLKNRKEQWAILFRTNKLYRSAILSLIWEYRDKRLGKIIYNVQLDIEHQQKEVFEGFVVNSNALNCLRSKNISNSIIASLQSLPGHIVLKKDSFSEIIEQAIGKEAYDKYQEEILWCTTMPSAGYVVTGPEYPYESEEQLYHDLAMHWKQSSFQMNALCQANGIQYYHFLQPNQYVAGSKRMTTEEKQLAINEKHPYKVGVENGYPLLRRFGRKLISLGINFTDMTMIFQNNSEILYHDSCCHLNKQGYDLIMEAIWKTIKEKNMF